MKTIKGNLNLKEDTTFKESIEVEGNITGYYNLTVIGNINARDINAWNINAWDINANDINANDITANDITAKNINAWDITAKNINAWDINANDITARDINVNSLICESRKKKIKNAKTIAKIFVTEKSKLERKEW